MSKYSIAKFRVMLLLVTLVEYLALFLLYNNYYVHADSFAPNGDIINCDYIPAIGIAISELPTNVDYDQTLIKGVVQNWITTHSLDAVADYRLGSVKRFRDIAGSVAVPPGTKLAIGYWWYNFSGHTINISDSNLIVSQNREGYDITKLLSGSYANDSFRFKYSGYWLTRSGKSINTGALGNFSSNSAGNLPKGRVIKTVEVIDPLNVNVEEYSCKINNDGTGTYEAWLAVKNRTAYALSSIAISGQNPILEPFTEARIPVSQQFIAQYNQTYTPTPITIEENSKITECATDGSDRGDTHDPSTRIMLVDRNDSGSSSWRGLQPDFASVPRGKFFCITKIPYSFKFQLPECMLPKEVKLSANLSKILFPGVRETLKITLVNDGIPIQNEQLLITAPNNVLFPDCEVLNVGNTEKHYNCGIANLNINETKVIELAIIPNSILAEGENPDVSVKIEYSGKAVVVNSEIETESIPSGDIKITTEENQIVSSHNILLSGNIIPNSLFAEVKLHVVSGCLGDITDVITIIPKSSKASFLIHGEEKFDFSSPIELTIDQLNNSQIYISEPSSNDDFSFSIMLNKQNTKMFTVEQKACVSTNDTCHFSIETSSYPVTCANDLYPDVEEAIESNVSNILLPEIINLPAENIIGNISIGIVEIFTDQVNAVWNHSSGVLSTQTNVYYGDLAKATADLRLFYILPIYLILLKIGKKIDDLIVGSRPRKWY